MKKWILGISIFVLVSGLSFFFFFKKEAKPPKIEVVLKEPLVLEFSEEKRVSDYIVSMNGKIVDDFIIDSTKLGEKKVSFRFINEENREVPYEFSLEVVDTKPPVIWLSGRYRVLVGSDESFKDRILCGDNYDSNPTCVIEGTYDLNTVGEYPLVFRATDSSGNEQVENFTLYVQESSTPVEQTKTYFSDVVATHKNEHTKIGLDVSSWQEKIDFSKIKEAGVEFMMIRIGGTKGTNGEYFMDSQFVSNLEQAKKYGIEVGLYFYSYANSVEHARRDARWIVEQMKDYDLDLPIAFDWEEWSYFNNYHMSFFELTNMAKAFIEEVEKAGYEGMLYSSKLYLEEVWLPMKSKVWLAHYTDQTDYQGKYQLWQLCSDGIIDGIDGFVDINVMYMD